MKKVAINGLGRIGRAALKIIIDNPGMELVVVNDLVPTENLAYLLKFDSVYGVYEKEVKAEENNLVIGGKKIPVLQEKDPEQLPWRDLGVQVVFECTGIFTNQEGLEKHLKAGAEKAVLSAPSKSPETMTVVHGVNSPGDEKAFSCASCTTNCITPIVEILGRTVGIKKAIMTTIHAYTSSQAIVDAPHKKMRRGRAGAMNIVPTTTGAANATIKALPQYQGKFDGIAMRVPVPAGSVADLVFVTERATSKEEINEIFKRESENDRYKGVLTTSADMIVSSDIIKNPSASIIDLDMTQVVDGDLVKIIGWYDNEWGYASQMVKTVSEEVPVEQEHEMQA